MYMPFFSCKIKFTDGLVANCLSFWLLVKFVKLFCFSFLCKYAILRTVYHFIPYTPLAHQMWHCNQLYQLVMGAFYDFDICDGVGIINASALHLKGVNFLLITYLCGILVNQGRAVTLKCIVNCSLPLTPLKGH